MAARPAGHHARQTARRKARIAIALGAVVVVAAAAIAAADRLSAMSLLVAAAVVVGGIWLLDRSAVPSIERWSRGATGEEHVGRLLETLEPDGWLTIHDVDTGRGNVDTVVIGPGGVFTLEVKSHRGAVRTDGIDPAMLRQAYAQRKWLEAFSGQRATALLVFSTAYLVGKPVSRQRGVVVLPARLLAGHLQRYPAVIAAPEARLLHERLNRELGRLPITV